MGFHKNHKKVKSENLFEKRLTEKGFYNTITKEERMFVKGEKYGKQ